jgi:cellulose synthase (UDP-forming)
MTLLEGIEAGENPLFRISRYVLFAVAAVLLFLFGTIVLTLWQQFMLGVIMVLAAVIMGRMSRSYIVTLTLVAMSMFATFRYGFWRVHSVIDFFRDPASVFDPVDVFFMLILVAAEFYAFVILYLGYVQTVWPLRRQPVPMPDDPNLWPEVDLVIPTYNEPLEVVRATALASTNIDWPADKLNIYILDDGRRPEFREFAEEAGIGYICRDDNKGAKAGNINNGLKHMSAPFLAIFDCDHVPTRSFLQVTLGWFLRDQKLAMLQTPHHFYSPDPFERNLEQFRSIPNEGELFYGIVQDGNDFWNATFFCGSCAVLRRSALDEIGGIATDTVTEDAHTSLLMQMNGWNTAYINIPQAAGLATERLSGHVKQRIRWARGMIQVLRVDNPLTAKGLHFFQRLCYFNAMLHFTYALPRLIFLTAPLIYLILGHKNIPGAWNVVLAFALPHLVLSQVANSRIQGQHRHSYWNEIYETVLSPYILMPTMAALINPKLGKFNVTAKGGIVEESFFDARIALPFVVMLSFNVLGLLMTVSGVILGITAPDFIANNSLAHDFLSHLTWTGNQKGTIVMNVIWCLFNMIILGVATAVAWELQQRRAHVRIAMQLPASVEGPSGTRVNGETVDISSGGAAVYLSQAIDVSGGSPVKLLLPVPSGLAELPATVIGMSGRSLRLQFSPMTIHEEEMLTMVLYSRADNWLGWGESREADKPLRSLGRIFKLSMHGLSQTVRNVGRSDKGKDGKGRSVPVRAVVVLLGIFLGAAMFARAEVVPVSAARPGDSPEPNVPEAVSSYGQQGGTFHNQFSLRTAGAPDTIEMHGLDSYYAVSFALPQNQVVKQATIHLHYGFSPGLMPNVSHIKVLMNGSLIGTLQMPAGQSAAPTPDLGAGSERNASQEQHGLSQVVQDATLSIPAELLVRNNQLTFEFIGHYAQRCEDSSNSVLWARVDPNSTIDLGGVLLPLSDDLKMLPAPFYDPSLSQEVPLPVVFTTQPDTRMLEAAGVVASYFGVVANYRSLRFPVSVGTIPTGNAIIVTNNPAALPANFNIPAGSGATIAVRTNPSDPYSKVLIVSGDTGEQTMAAAQALALDTSLMQGSTAQARTVNLPTARQADDAPRWLSTDAHTPLWDVTTTDSIQGDGSAPLNVYLRIPPDLYYGQTKNLSLHLDYRYNGEPLAPGSNIKMLMNGDFIQAIPIERHDGVQTPSAVVPVPTVSLRPFSNTLTASLAFAVRKAGECQEITRNTQASLLKSSYLDLSGFSHWAAMPNLELFANAGFPFTRFADMSQTTIVLPDQPTPQEIQMYLTLLGYFGGQTGYPALRVSVANASVIDTKPDRDLLVLGTTTDQPALTALGDALPVSFDGGGIHVQEVGGVYEKLRRAWWNMIDKNHDESGSLSVAGDAPDAILEGIESPWAKSRSVVVIAVKSQEEVQPFINAFMLTSQSSDIGKSVSVLHGTKFDSYRILNNVYHVGEIDSWTQLNLWFAQYPLLVIVLIIMLCLLMAVFARAQLRRRARGRLLAREA